MSFCGFLLVSLWRSVSTPQGNGDCERIVRRREMRMGSYELIPTDGRKSFYHKAIVEVDSSGVETLYSYGTKIISRDSKGKLTRFYDGWTTTTGRHIKAFCGLNKAAFLEMAVIRR